MAPTKAVKKTTKAAATTPAKAKKAPVKKAPEPAPTPVAEPVEAPATNTVVQEVASIESTLSASLTSFASTIQALTQQLAKLKADFKVIEKQVIREARSMDKINAKRNKNKGSRAPSGFVKPAKITTELADFLGVAHGTEMARTDVTREITKYVRTHNLQDKENGRKINPDAKLRKLLKAGEKEEVTYFNLQKFMSQHFLKA
jgi:chromatin remodeling complex protein RSC6